jgi:uncharacterized repeat protein (TIGR04076 family)
VSTGYRVRCTVDSMNYSACAMKPGDYFEVDAGGELSMPDGQGFCYFAIASAVPHVTGYLGGADWPSPPPLVACPDPPEALYLRLERVGEEP